MTVLDDKLVPVARSMLERLGKSVVYNKVTGGVYDPAQGKVTGAATVAHNVKIAPPFPIKEDLIHVSAQNQANVNDIYKFGDMTTYLADEDLPFTPAAGRDTIVLDGQTLQVIAARPIRSGELIALWELHLRKN